uniref:Uncharacterized protein n=1 Tax=Meloidogyne incognita TaxID=6306 RepID=A0A914MYT0_MELIC
MELDNDQCQLLLFHDSKIMQLIDVEVDDFQCLKQIKLEFNGEIGQIFWYIFKWGFSLFNFYYYFTLPNYCCLFKTFELLTQACT